MTTTIGALSVQVRKLLDELTIEELTETYGQPQIYTLPHAGQGHWRQGDGRPEVVAETPAMAQAIGLCAAARIRNRDAAGSLGFTGLGHRGECGYCTYPLDILLRTLDHANWLGGYLVVDLAVWPTRDGSSYVRETGRAGEYAHPAWARFFDGTTPATAGHTRAEREHLRSVRARAIADELGIVEVAS